MGEFEDADLRDSTFRRTTLAGSRFQSVDLSDTEFRGALIGNVVMRGVDLFDVDFHGELKNVVLNGVDVAPLVEAELDRRDPERVKMRPTHADGFREAWGIVEHRWDATVARARQLDEALLHESVDGEWSFIQTLRHLVFATDIWVSRAIGGDPTPWHPLSLPFDEMEPHPDVPWDRDARPTLDEVIALRRDRMSKVQAVLDDLTDEQLAGHTTPVDVPGWPPPGAFPVVECLLTVLNEEYLHRHYAERDLAVLESR